MAGSRFKAENGLLVTGANSFFEQEVSVGANLYVTADLLYVGANLYVGGNIIYTNTQIGSDLTPLNTEGTNLGNTSNRFDGYFRNINVSGNIHPSANGLLLGNNSARWYAYTTNISATGTLTLTGAATLSNTITVAGYANVNNKLAAGNTTITGYVNATSSGQFGGNLDVGGAATIGGNVTSSGTVTGTSVVLDNALITSNTKSVTNTSVNIVDSFPKSTGYFGKLLVTVNLANTSFHNVEITFLHDNTNVLVNKYGEVFNASLGTFDARITGANVEVTFQASAANTYTVKTLRQVVLS